MRPVPTHYQPTHPTSLGIGSSHSRRPEHCSISIKDSVHTSTFETKISKIFQVQERSRNVDLRKCSKRKKIQQPFHLVESYGVEAQRKKDKKMTGAKRSGKTTLQCWPRHAKTLPWWSSRRRWAMPTKEVLEPAMIEPTQTSRLTSPRVCLFIHFGWGWGGH